MSKQGYKYLPSILLVGLILVLNQSILLVQATSLGPIIEPQQGDYLLYNFTIIDVYGQAQSGTFNLSFYTPPFYVNISSVQHEINDTYFPDVFKCVGESSNWTLMGGYDPGEDFEFWCMANITDRSTFWYYDTDLYGNWSSYFPWIIPTNVSVGSKVPYSSEITIDEAGNYTLSGVKYSSLFVYDSIDSDFFSTLIFDMISGVLLSENYTWTTGEILAYYIMLIGGRVGNFSIPKIPTTVSCNVIPSSTGVTVTGSINPALSGRTVIIYITGPGGKTTNITTTIGPDGSFSHEEYLGKSGDYYVKVYFGGDAMYEWSQSQEVPFTFELPPDPRVIRMRAIIIGLLIIGPALGLYLYYKTKKKSKPKQIGTPDEQDIPDVDQGLEFLGQEGLVYPIDTGDEGLIPPRVLERWETCCRDKWEELNEFRKTLPRREKKIIDLEKQRDKLEKEVNDLAERTQTCENEYNELKDKLENMSFSWYGRQDKESYIEKRARYNRLKKRRTRALGEKKTELDRLGEVLKGKRRDLKNMEGALSREKLEFDTAILTEKDLFLNFVECRQSHRPIDRITQLVKKWTEIQKEIDRNELKLKDIPKQRENLKKELAAEEDYYDFMTGQIDGGAEGRGIYMHTTDVKVEIERLKKKLVEIDNLERSYQVEIKKLKNKIADIRKEIDRSGVYD